MTYSQTNGQQVCTSVNVTSTIDATPLYEVFKKQSGQTGSFKPPTGDFASVNNGGSKWLVSGNGYNTADVRDGVTQSFSACWCG